MPPHLSIKEAGVATIVIMKKIMLFRISTLPMGGIDHHAHLYRAIESLTNSQMLLVFRTINVDTVHFSIINFREGLLNGFRLTTVVAEMEWTLCVTQHHVISFIIKTLQNGTCIRIRKCLVPSEAI